VSFARESEPAEAGATTLSDEPAAQPARPEPSLLRTAGGYSVSVFQGLLAGVVLQLWTTAFLGWLGPDALYVRSIYAPVGFLTLAVTEGLVVASQITAGIAARGGRRAQALRPVPTFILAGSGLLVVLTAVFAAGSHGFLSVLHVTPGKRGEVIVFVVAMSLSTAVGFIPYLGGAVLRGIGRPGLASALGVALTLLSMAGMVACNALTDLGALSVPVGGLPATVVVGLATAVLLRRYGITVPSWRPRRDALGEIWLFAAPVAATFLLLAAVSFGYLWVLRNAAPADIAGFSLGQLATSFFLVVAFAVGSGAAIATNLRPGEDRRPVNRAGMSVTLRLVLPPYLVVSAAAYLFREPLARLLTSDRSAAAVAADYFAWVGPTFVVFGGTLALLTYLEQTGRARAAFVLNAVYFAVVMAVAVALPQPVDSTTLARLLAVSNVVGFFTLWFSVRYLVHRGRRDGR
jgi:Na+-driven multidrug efflux pump